MAWGVSTLGRRAVTEVDESDPNDVVGVDIGDPEHIVLSAVAGGPERPELSSIVHAPLTEGGNPVLDVSSSTVGSEDLGGSVNVCERRSSQRFRDLVGLDTSGVAD